jgi:hypothetical protein
MSLYNLVATAVDNVLARLVRRAVLAFFVAVFALIAIYHFTAAATLALEMHFGELQAQLIVAGIYTIAAAAILAMLWRSAPKAAIPSPPRPAKRESQLAMLIEAAVVGFAQAKKSKRQR